MSLYGRGPGAQNFADGVLVNSRVLASVYPGTRWRGTRCRGQVGEACEQCVYMLRVRTRTQAHTHTHTHTYTN